MLRYLFIILVTAMLGICIVPSFSFAYYIDGNISDWGIDLSNANAVNLGYLDDNLPSGGRDIDKFTEDNDYRGSEHTIVGPSMSFNNLYDAEALYFDNDDSYLYMALVTGVPGFNSTSMPDLGDWGDIFIDKGKFQSGAGFTNSSYEYALDISASKLFSVTGTYGTENPSFHSDPWILRSGTLINTPDLELAINPLDQNSHYVLEAKIAMASLGLSLPAQDQEKNLWIHWTMSCGNDMANLKSDINVTPEPVSMALFALGAGALGLNRLRRKK